MKELLFNIGEFSRMTGLSIKALRLYHEKDIMVPFRIDEFTNYRFYSRSNLELARIITALRSMDFGLKEIKELLENFDDDSGIVSALEAQKLKICHKILNYEKILNSMDLIILKEKTVQNKKQANAFQVEEKTIEPMLIAGLRFKGKYKEAGKYIGKLAGKMSRNICGPPFCLYYDKEYKEEDAEIEVCYPVKEEKEYPNVVVRRLKGANVISLIHNGPYEQLSHSYSKIISEIKSRNGEMDLPIRETYLKGPGMIFKGNPQNYLTEIQISVRESGFKT